MQSTTSTAGHHAHSAESSVNTPSAAQLQSKSSVGHANTPSAAKVHSAESPANTQSAAQHVFGLPELLENILLHVAFADGKDAEPDKTFGHITKPSRVLFVLQRVNSAFQDTIKRNKTLQQRMFLEPADNGQGRFSTLSWLIEHVGIFNQVQRLTCFYFIDDDDNNDDNDDNDILLRSTERDDLPEPFLKEDHTTSVASWREMKLLCTAKPVSIIYVHWSYEGPHELCKFEHGSSVTLGMIFDGLRRLQHFIDRYEAADPDSEEFPKALQDLLHEAARNETWQCGRQNA